jgi:hypothetical protein
VEYGDVLKWLPTPQISASSSQRRLNPFTSMGHFVEHLIGIWTNLLQKTNETMIAENQ